MRLLYGFAILMISVGSSLIPVSSQSNLNFCGNGKAFNLVLTCNYDSNDTQQAAIRDDYTYTPEVGAHKLHTRAKTFNQARKACIEEGGHLAIVNSKREANVLADVLSKSGKNITGGSNIAAFVGIHDLYEEGDWVTIFGEPLNSAGYAEWTTRFGHLEPDNYNGRQNCGTLVVGGGFDDVFCDSNHAFFCELPQAWGDTSVNDIQESHNISAP